MRVPQACSTTIHPPGNDATMQDYKQSTSKARSFVPTINTTSRTTKSPLTPRILGSAQPSVSPRFRPAASTELETGPRGASREEISTPVKTLLSSNITPRSGARKARVDSASTTPTATPDGTPNSSRPASMVGAPPSISKGAMGMGLGIGEVGHGRAIRPRSMILEGNISDLYNRLSPGSDGPTGYGRMGASPESSSLSFHASDARSSLSSQGPFQRSNHRSKPASLVDADGIDDADSSYAATFPLPEEPKSKFFHANDIPISRNILPKTMKITHKSPTTPSPRLATFNTHPKPYLQQRPPSPLKEEQRISRSSSLKVSPRNYTPLVPNGAVHQIELIPSTGQRASQDGLGRRSSLSTPASRRVSHAKASSISSLDSTPTKRKSLRLADAPISLTTPATKNTELEIDPKDGTTDGATAVKDNIGSVAMPQSPSKAPQNKLQQMNELAADARRERKVLDLEISNSSLLAINKTLEREMRKQNNELRRYKKLSRSGRLSMATSLRSISVGGLSMLSETDTASDFSELPEEDELDEPYSDDESLFDAGTMTPNTYAEHDARLRAKDEKRLQLDLSKHRELLVDSQKMNQSIKRCLGWTEDLIREANKALEYHVRVSDIGVRGRVLTPDEVEPDTLHRRGLLSPALDELADPLGEGAPLDAHVEDEGVMLSDSEQQSTQAW